MENVVEITGKKGEKVLVPGSYKCTDHADSWFSFNRNETFGLCPRCRNEHKIENTWFSSSDNSNNYNTNNIRKVRFDSFLSSFLAIFS